MTQHEPLRMQPWAWWLVVLLVGEIVGWVAFQGDAMRAGLVMVMLTAGLLPVAVAVVINRPVWLARLQPSHGAILCVLMFIGLASLGVGLLQGNEPYYIAADVYHWFIEVIAMTVVTAMIFGQGSARQAARAVAVIGLGVGIVCVLTFVLGSLCVIEGGTHFVHNLGIARLIVGRGTPQLMLIVVVATLWHRRKWDHLTQCLLMLACAALAISLAVTLKRTLWLSFPIAAVVAVMPRRWLIGSTLAVIIFGPLVILFALRAPETVDAMIQSVVNLLTYNPGFTIEETLARRSEQMQSVWPYIAQQPGGYGLGASFFAYWSRGQMYTEVHYIHNFYAYYALQFGVGLLLLLIALMAWLGWTWVKQDDRANDWGFAVRAGLGCLVALAINGISLVPTHTLFAGFAIGLGMIGSAKIKQESAA